MQPQWEHVEIPIEIQEHPEVRKYAGVSSADIRDYMTDDYRHNAVITMILCRLLWPNHDWKIYACSQYALVSDGGMVQLINYLTYGTYHESRVFYVCDAVHRGRKTLNKLMRNDAGDWRVFVTVDDFLS